MSGRRAGLPGEGPGAAETVPMGARWAAKFHSEVGNEVLLAAGGPVGGGASLEGRKAFVGKRLCRDAVERWGVFLCDKSLFFRIRFSGRCPEGSADGNETKGREKGKE